MGPGADHSRQKDASRADATQARESEQPRSRPQAAGDADQRERDAVVREAFADLREREADQREREADQREREADQRESVADEREREADQREEQMRVLIGELRGLVSGAHRDALEAIERSLALLSASADRFERSGEAVQRVAARRRREETATARTAAADERQRTYSSSAGQGLVRRAKEIRTRLAATVAAFAVAEDNVARLFDQLAISHPEDAGAYQRRAQQAQEAADRAREISRQLAH